MKIDQVLEICYSDSKNQYIQNLFEFVREIPYEINWAYSPELLLERWKWYCVSKHRLLKALFAKIEIKSYLVYISFKFENIYLPKELLNWWLANKKWYHVYLKADMGNWLINIDASFPKLSKKYYRVNDNRDWKLSQKISVGDNIIQEYIIEDDDMEKRVKNEISDIDWSNPDNTKRIWLFNQRMNDLNSCIQ